MLEKTAREILEHKYRYYILNDPLISDREYDKLEKKYEEALKDVGLGCEKDPHGALCIGFPFSHPWAKEIEEKFKQSRYYYG